MTLIYAIIGDEELLGMDSQSSFEYISKLSGHGYIIDQDIASITRYFSTRSYKECLSRCEWILDFVWEKLNTGNWKDVDDCWRSMYYVTSHYKCICEHRLGKDLNISMKTCDLGILMGIRPSGWASLTKLAATFTQMQDNNISKHFQTGK